MIKTRGMDVGGRAIFVTPRGGYIIWKARCCDAGIFAVLSPRPRTRRLIISLGTIALAAAASAWVWLLALGFRFYGHKRGKLTHPAGNSRPISMRERALTRRFIPTAMRICLFSSFDREGERKPERERAREGAREAESVREWEHDGERQRERERREIWEIDRAEPRRPCFDKIRELKYIVCHLSVLMYRAGGGGGRIPLYFWGNGYTFHTSVHPSPETELKSSTLPRNRHEIFCLRFYREFSIETFLFRKYSSWRQRFFISMLTIWFFLFNQ